MFLVALLVSNNGDDDNDDDLKDDHHNTDNEEFFTILLYFWWEEPNIDQLVDHDVEDGEGYHSLLDDSHPSEFRVVHKTQVVFVHIILSKEEQSSKEG